ncbi:hypothetical protein HGRIS_001442 [Hohenbuehelia grisea]|uniref:Prolyl endopeptidase n=1 Tax=Hohenbuehelia grisea TaxID=104357 RepID=A0ABR3JPI0_9AGAR
MLLERHHAHLIQCLRLLQKFSTDLDYTAQDILVHKDDENPDWMWSTGISDQLDKYLFLYITKDTSEQNLVWISDLQENNVSSNMKWIKLIDEWEWTYDIVANDGPNFYIKTNKKAPMHQVITIDLSDPYRQQKILIAEDPHTKLMDIQCLDGDKFVVLYQRNVHYEVYVVDMDGQRLLRVAEDYVGAMSVSRCRRSQSWFFLTIFGFDSPGVIRRYGLPKRFLEGAVEESSQKLESWSVWWKTPIKGIITDDFRTSQVWYKSFDGTLVPMYIVRHKDTPFDGTAAAIQWGYGGFNASIGPFFDPGILTFLQNYKAIFAMPNIRGGGEFGEGWHQGGMRERKLQSQN